MKTKKLLWMKKGKKKQQKNQKNKNPKNFNSAWVIMEEHPELAGLVRQL